jgi:fatty acid/phospholipid synthesis protein PlsX
MPNPGKCKVVLDAMGGDFAPENEILGAIQAEKEDSNLEVWLAGKKDEIEKVLREKNLQFDLSRIIDSEQVVTMNDLPVQAYKEKQGSSLAKGLNFVKNGDADAFVSAGNTGAVMTFSLMIYRKIKGIDRPTIGTLMPCIGGFCTIFDAGASVDSKAHHLAEYAVLGSIYAREMLNKPNPSVGVLSVGEEESKGNEISKKAVQLIKPLGLNFKGNVEGKDILKGNVDVAVCDGFTGNIILKFAEGVTHLLKHLIKEYAEEGFFKKIRVGLFKSSLKSIFLKT